MAAHEGNLMVIGAVSAGNIAHGTVRIEPTPNTPTPVAITGLDLQGSGSTVAVTTPFTGVPGATVIETSTSEVLASGMTVWLYRKNDTSTVVYWSMFRSAT